jgi:hypothetical protein
VTRSQSFVRHPTRMERLLYEATGSEDVYTQSKLGKRDGKITRV